MKIDTSNNLTVRWAKKIRQIGLRQPAIILLEAHKPLSFITGQFLLIGQPILNIFLPSHITNHAISLFSERGQLEYLINELEQG